MGARISFDISDVESATERFWHTGQRRPEAISRMRASTSSCALAVPARSSSTSAPRTGRRHRSLDRPVLTLALPLAHRASPRVLELRVDRLGAERAAVLVGDPPGAVDDERLRNAPHAVADGDPVPAVDAVRVGDPELAHELPRGVLAILHVDAEEHDVLLAVALPRRLEEPRLRAARRAPRRPEVEEHHLAAEVRELGLAPVHQAGGEGRRRTADEGGG